MAGTQQHNASSAQSGVDEGRYMGVPSPDCIGDTILRGEHCQKHYTQRQDAVAKCFGHRQLMNTRNECVQSGYIVTIVARKQAARRADVEAVRTDQLYPDDRYYLCACIR